MPLSNRSMVLGLLAVLLGTLDKPLQAASPVYFDVSNAVSCQDVTPEHFAAEYPGEKLVQASLQVSTLFQLGQDSQVAACLYQFYAPEQRLIVQDYLPTTTLVSDIVGHVNVQEATESSHSLQASLHGQQANVISADLGLGGQRGQSSSVRYEMLPPHEMLSAAGTIGRGTGVYFKLKPTARQPLEGSRDFVLMLRVPTSWRADYLRATFQAKTAGGTICGQSNYLVPLYVQGDVTAKSLALRLHASERQLIALSQKHHKAIRRASLPSLAHELSLLQRQVPADWLSSVLIESARGGPEPFEEALPPAIQQAITDYRTAKQNVAFLSTHVTNTTPTPVATPASMAATAETGFAETTAVVSHSGGFQPLQSDLLDK